MAFVSTPAAARLPRPQASSAAHAARACAHAPPSRLSRRQLLSGGAAAAAALVAAAAVAPPRAASAANGSGLERAFSKVLFPKEGFNAPDSLTPSAKLVNRDVLASKEAKAALTRIRGYDNDLSDLFARFKQDPQLELAAPVRKLVSISDLRSALNIVNEAIDEESQIQTDKVVRGIIQDIGELENAAIIKKGSVRTAKKIERTNDWFLKLTADFSRLLSFYL